MLMKTNKKDAELIALIGERAIREEILPREERLNLDLCLTACHLNGCPLRLQALLEATPGNFAHDIMGIYNHTDRATGKLTGPFVPRYRENIDYLPDDVKKKLNKGLRSAGYVDAQEQHRLNPDTFEVESPEAFAALKAGDNVKVCHNGERFWVKVVAIEGEEITGTVNNDLWVNQPFKLGDTITFEKRHVFQILTQRRICDE